ncbi:MAG: hypothetical protein LBQ81_07070 [Zoogloeaceae bacterium]|jgi:hypothetical protein|nr:hypothetical protein [Zoogloeaceae bacterium]
MSMQRFFGILAFFLLLVCNANADSIALSDRKTPFEGTWERMENEMTRWKFVGNTYEVYWELEGEFGEHYYKGTFTYKENVPNRGIITFEQTHSAVTSGAWKPDTDTEITHYNFIDGATLAITSARYRKK